jgi:hypothetical protein
LFLPERDLSKACAGQVSPSGLDCGVVINF